MALLSGGGGGGCGGPVLGEWVGGSCGVVMAREEDVAVLRIELQGIGALAPVGTGL